MTPEREKKIEETRESLTRVQDFEVDGLGRKGDLGALNFEDAVPHARRLVELFQQVAPEILDGLPEAELDKIKKQADAAFSRFSQVRDFDVEGANPKQQRDQITNQIEKDYDGVWAQLQPSISYSVRRQMNFASLEREFRAHLQAVKDSAEQLKDDLATRKEEAETVLAEIRKVAAEQGVSQEAIYFKEESEKHAAEAETWFGRTKTWTVWLGLFAAVTIFLHKLPWIAPTSELEAVQMIVSKFLVFATIASFVLLSARNFMAHRHNAVVNKHRQNALVTYTALAEAASDSANREVILIHASECIFSPQPTGFGKGERSDGALSMVNLAGGLKSPAVGGE